MSPPEVLSQPKRRLQNRKVETHNDSAIGIVEVAEDKQDYMYCPDWARRAVMLLPITAAAAIYSGYRYWKLQFDQILFLGALGMNMHSRTLFAVINLILTGKYTLMLPSSQCQQDKQRYLNSLSNTRDRYSTDAFQNYSGCDCNINAYQKTSTLTTFRQCGSKRRCHHHHLQRAC